MKNKIFIILMILGFTLSYAEMKPNQPDTIDISKYYIPDADEVTKIFFQFDQNSIQTKKPTIIMWMRGVSDLWWYVSEIINEKAKDSYMSYNLNDTQLRELTDNDVGEVLKRFVAIREDISSHSKTIKENQRLERKILIAKMNHLDIHGYKYVGDIIKIADRKIFITSSTLPDKNTLEYYYYQKGIGKIAHETRTCKTEKTLKESIDCKVQSIAYEVLTRFDSPQRECIYKSKR